MSAWGNSFGTSFSNTWGVISIIGKVGKRISAKIPFYLRKAAPYYGK